jgi:hypothetical protein
MVLHTKLHADQADLPRRDVAQFVGVVTPDDGMAFTISFVSSASVRLFISEMAPRDVHVCVAEGEDRDVVTAMLLRDISAPLH